MPVYLIARSSKYIREGIDDVGDIFEVFEGDEAPSGPGYALSDVVEIGTLSKEDVDTILSTCRVIIDYDPKTDKEYWWDTSTQTWYEIKIKPKYELNLASLTLEDKATLANTATPSQTQIGLMGEKIQANIKKYPQNSETVKPQE